MKRFIAIILTCLMLLTGCSQQAASPSATTAVTPESVLETTSDAEEQSNITLVQGDDAIPEFTSLDSPELLQYVEESIYTDLVYQFDSEDYIIENVTAAYVSREYLEEIAYNSQENIYFGYKLSELDAQFVGTRYVFTLGESGETVVQPFEGYDDTYDQVLKNVAIGTGVILVCVTVSVISSGLGAPVAVSMVFAASAKTATTFALSSGVISGFASGVIKGFQTKDFDEALKAAALGASEGFKWGAITGAIAGGINKALTIHRAAKLASTKIPTWREAELMALKEYGGTEQLSYLNGGKVPFGTPGSTRPDLVRNIDGVLEAIEVKNYNLANKQNLAVLYRELEREIPDRVANLPAGTTQRICLNVQGRGFTAQYVDDIIASIHALLEPYYPNIPIDVMGAVI